jgi:hypothetical protein
LAENEEQLDALHRKIAECAISMNSTEKENLASKYGELMERHIPPTTSEATARVRSFPQSASHTQLYSSDLSI